LSSVLEICKLVDGSPLGIELAAVWLRSLTPADLVQEIKKSMDGLETPSRNIVERHQSLRAVFDYSWKLLKPKEQTALAMLTVFVGGFTREAAAPVTDATIPILTSLVDKSLLKIAPDGRYERHALLYEFAHEKLLAQPALQQEMQQKHLTYFVTLAEEIAPKLTGSEQAFWLERVQSELDNLRAALAFAVKDKQTEAGLRLALALSEFWLLRNYREGYQRTVEALALPKTDADMLLRIKTLNSAGWLATLVERYEEAKTHYEEALSLAQQRSDNNGVAGAFLGLGQLARFQGDLPAAQGFLEKSLALYRNLDDKRRLARASAALGVVFVYQGKLLEAKPFFEEALRVHQAVGDPRLISVALGNSGALSEQLGEFATAKEYYQQSLALAKTINDKSAEATALHNLAGCLRKLQEDPAIARTYYARAFELFLGLDAKYGAL
jgi:tetratricopeptide (TPR) repeat protein